MLKLIFRVKYYSLTMMANRHKREDFILCWYSVSDLRDGRICKFPTSFRNSRQIKILTNHERKV